MSDPDPGQGEVGAAVRQEWGERAAAWRRWAPRWAAQTREATRLVVEAAGVAAGSRVLDLASGSGEPALTLATLVGPAGHVMATDVAPEMLAIAADEARARGLANLTCTVADAARLPVADRGVDAVTCRFGIAHVADPAAALRAAHRVLVPGGRAAFVVWGPREHNPFFTIVDEAFAPYPQPRHRTPAAPGPFTFATPGSLSSALRAAGFAAVHEETHVITLPWPGPVDDAWAGRCDMSGSCDRVLATLTRAQRDRVVETILTALRRYDDGRYVTLPAVVIVAAGTRA